MRIYIIRHGVTESNADNIRQSREGFLSEEGISEARALSDKMSGLVVDSIFTSPYPRAKQTADIISGKVNQLLVQESEYLSEIRLPSELIGIPTDDAKAKRIIATIDDHSGEKGWRYSDEESFDEYSGRAFAVLEHITKTGFQNVVVVTHHRFIKVLVGVVLLGKNFTADLFTAIKNNVYISNSGITICEQNEETRGAWRLLTLNDHSHVVSGVSNEHAGKEN